ncbi:MAG: polysaccharide biosynthesis protein [Bacteroidetes bacterium]|nr:MAG: polysaccharide biosynthesis protein [Bacteroidota bacterium]
MSLLKKLAGETAIYGVSSILSRLLNYVILVPFFTRIFLNGEYGIVSEIFTYAGILTILFTYRMETAFFRFGNRKDQQEKAFSTATLSLLCSTILFSGVLLFFVDELTRWFHFDGHPEYVMLTIGIIAFDALTAIPFARLRLQNRPIRFAILKTANILINILSIFFFLKICPEMIERGHENWRIFFDPDNKIQYVFIANLIASGGLVLAFLPEYLRLKLEFDTTLWRQMIVYALPLIVVGIASVVNQLIAIPMLTNLLPGTIEENRVQTGLYGATAKLAVLMNLFTQAFNYAAEPFFFRHSERSDSKIIYAQVGQAFALVGSFVFLGIVLYLDIIQYFLGKNFREGLGIVPILLLANFALGLYYNFSIWYKLTDRTVYGMYISLAGMVITIGLNCLLIPRIGYFGPAWAALACYGFMSLAGYLTGQHFYPIYYPIKKMLGYIGIAIGIYFLSAFFQTYTGENLALRLTINTGLLLVYAGIIFWWEKKTILRMLKPAT